MKPEEVKTLKGYKVKREGNGEGTTEGRRKRKEFRNSEWAGRKN
jgi:hypothetical protein